MAGMARLERHVSELLAYLERNRGASIHYATRRRNDELIPTVFQETTVNEIMTARMNRKRHSDLLAADVAPMEEPDALEQGDGAARP